jgi:ATP-binding cassette subfamily C (CFTR/MRP) protein 1
LLINDLCHGVHSLFLNCINKYFPRALVWVVRNACQLETDCVAIERIMEYTNIEQEASWEGQDVPNWPDKGVIQFQKYETRYREGLDLVLKDINMEVKSEENIGICGRTGAGKSSLTLALFRIIEPTGGTIFVDGQDISLLGLHSLRSKLTIIPQVKHLKKNLL